MTRLREVMRQVAEIARAHGHRIELGWFADLLTYHNVMWVDSWVRSSTLWMVLVLLNQVEQLVATLMHRGRLTLARCPSSQGSMMTAQLTLAHTIAHLRC